MIRGLFTGASAMLVYGMRQDLLANDLANVQTPAYRPQDAPIRSFPELFIHEEIASRRLPRGPMGTGATLDPSVTRWTQAPVRYTGRPLDLAIEGEGFFAVLTPAGPRLTRAGNFTVGADGWLATPDGYPLLGEQGPIEVSGLGAEEIVIAPDGQVLGPEGQSLGRILVVDVSDRQGLVREGANLFRFTEASGGPVRVEVPVRQGMLESSAASVVRTMVEMIAAVRAYQAAQVVVRSHDEVTGDLIAQLGRSS